MGFDDSRVHVARLALLQKRCRSVARAWPAIAESLSDRFVPLFSEYADANAAPLQGNASIDGRAFARWLERRGELSESARIQTILYDVQYKCRSGTPIERRLPYCTVRWLPGWRCVVFAIWLPWLGVYSWHKHLA